MLTKKYIEAHLDVENGHHRDQLFFQFGIPKFGVQPSTGLIVYVGGYGSEYNDTYTNKLLEYLSNQYDCVAVAVKYFGSHLYGQAVAVPDVDFFDNLKKYFGITVSASARTPPEKLLSDTLEQICACGITELDSNCRALLKSDDYNSFGVLPALDHLMVVGDILNTFKLNEGRLFLLGTSCGGHIVSMMFKFAPNTFRMIIENSGFTSSDDHLPGIYGVFQEKICGVKIVGIAQHRWVKTPGPYFFSDAHKKIRSLLEADHVNKSETHLFSYHWERDEVASIDRKRRLINVYADKIKYNQEIITSTMLDGRVFKTAEHGMQASMRGIFSRSYSRFMKSNKPERVATDFSLRTQLNFDCGNLTYHISYLINNEVRLSVSERSGCTALINV